MINLRFCFFPTHKNKKGSPILLDRIAQTVGKNIIPRSHVVLHVPSVAGNPSKYDNIISFFKFLVKSEFDDISKFIIGYYGNLYK